jgi:hypothetical protein
MGDPGAFPTGTVTFLFTDVEGSTKLWRMMRRRCRRHWRYTIRSCVSRSRNVALRHDLSNLTAAFEWAIADDGWIGAAELING